MLAGRDALKFQADYAKERLWCLGGQPYSRYPGITYLGKSMKGLLLCGTTENMFFPRGVNGKPLVLAPEGAYLIRVFAPINALVSGKRYRWVLSHSLETLCLEGMKVALGRIGWKVLSRSTSHEGRGYFGPVIAKTLSRLWRKPDSHFPLRDLRRAVSTF